MCGPSAEQTKLQDQQTAFYEQMQKQDAVTFNEDQDILKQMQSVYAPILAKGPNQQGFSDAQRDDLNTQATEGVARNFAHANTALREQQAASGGGDEFLPSGVKDQQQEQMDIAAEGAHGDQQLTIKNDDYAAGKEEFDKATTALQGTSSLLNPNGYAGSANTAGKNATDTANTIAAQSTSWMAPLAGVVSGVAGAATGGYLAHH
jgi:hypothetical protein